MGDCHEGNDIVPSVWSHCGGIGGQHGDDPCGVFPHILTVCPDGSGEFTTIQAAIDVAGDDHIIELCDDTYTGPGNRDLDLLGKALTLRSASGNPEACIIDCQGTGGAITSASDMFLLEGITITNASGTAAVQCWDCAPRIENCIFSGNEGAVWCFQTVDNIVFIDCAFLDNSAYAVRAVSNSLPWFNYCVFAGNSGGVIDAQFSSVTCRKCTFYDNSTDGSGVVSLWQSGGWFNSCTFSGNAADSGVIYTHTFDVHLILEKTIIAYSSSGMAVYCAPDPYTTDITITCCDIYGNAGGDWVGWIETFDNMLGNFSECPSFCDAGSGDLHLCDQSPCLPGNHPYGYACETIGAWGEGCACGPTRTEGATWGAIKAMFR